MSTNFEIRQQESCRQFVLRTITMIRDVNSVFLHDHSARNSTTTQVQCPNQCSRIYLFYVFSDFQKRDLLRFLSDVSKSRKKSLTTVYSSILRSVIIVIHVSYLSVSLVYLGTYRTLTYFLVNVNTTSHFWARCLMLVFGVVDLPVLTFGVTVERLSGLWNCTCVFHVFQRLFS